ncbi:MAG: hypothetical protein R3F02_15645 [Thiolinea sp.]
MKNLTFITSGLIAGLLFASTGVMAGPQGDNHKYQPQKHSVTKPVPHKVSREHAKDIRGVNVANFEKMIEAGIQRGKLTRTEAITANKGLQSLKSAIWAAKRDHRISRQEEKKVQWQAAQLTRQINFLLNNRVVVAKHGKPSKHGHR